MSEEKSIQLYEKIDKLSKRIESYTEKEISIKTKAKSNSYIKKIKELINMIDHAKKYAPKHNNSGKDDIEYEYEEENEDNKYNPYSEEFIFKDKLKQYNGDICNMLISLKEEDQIGYRNAYAINEIIKYALNSNDKELKKEIRRYQNSSLCIRKKFSLWGRIKRFLGVGRHS